MADKARARRGVIGLHVPVVIPRQGRDAIALIKAPGLHGISQLTGASKTIPVGIPVAGIVPGDRDDFLVPVYPLGVAHNRRDRERDIHHQTIHGDLLFGIERGMYRFAVGVGNPCAGLASGREVPVINAFARRASRSSLTLQFDEVCQQGQLGPFVHHRIDVVIHPDHQTI